MYSDMKLKDKIRLYTVEELKDFAYYLGLKKYSKLRKNELVDAVSQRFLEPETMFYRMSVFDDEAIKVFEKGIGKCCGYSEGESEIIAFLNAIGYIVTGGGSFYVLEDAAEVWREVADAEFHDYRKRASWVWKCVNWAEEMYGVTPSDVLLDVVNVRKGMRMTEQELNRIFDHFPQDELWTVRISDSFLLTDYAGDEDMLRNLQMRQAGKDFYIPTVSEVEELFRTGALLSTPEYQKMKSYLIRKLHVPEKETEDIIIDLWDRISYADDFHDTMQWLGNQVVLDGESQLRELLDLYVALTNNTRILHNRGHKPGELLHRSKIGPGRMPTIMAGSSHAAKMLSEAAPELKKMGFGVDLDSNAGKVSVVNQPEGPDGPVKITQKKIYPNDPCPCGSGRKYKKCCGKN